MADARGGRGQARGGRGGGDRGGRGGRGGSFSGGRGGDRGGRRGGSRGDGGGFRGDRGGRGGRGGSFGGGGSDRGGFGGDGGGRVGGFGRGGRGDGGRGRGARGGFAPRRDAFEGETYTFYGQGSAIPQPDTDVTNLENAIIERHRSADQTLVKKMGSMKLTDSTVSHMPRRPAYGTKGRQIIVWANYFRMTIKPSVLYRYNLEVRKGENAEEPADDPKGRRKGKAQGGGGGAGGGNEPPTSVPKRKLKIILQHALAELQRLEPKAVLATEFKSQLVSLNRLQLAKNPIVVKFKNESATREELYNVKIVSETEALLAAMAQYLRDMVDPSDPNDAHFPHFETSVNALDVVLSHSPHANDEVAAVVLHTCSSLWNLSGVKFAKVGLKITNWNWSVQQFVQFLNGSGVAINIQAPNTPYEIVVRCGIAIEDIRRAFAAIADHTTKAKGGTKGFFLLIILPKQNTTLYSAVKSLANVQFSFHSVCSVESTFLKNSPQTFANISLKWNLNNSSNNHAVKDTINIVTSGKAMIVRYNVMHPTNMPDDRSAALSLIGIVASVDKDLRQWPAVA
ncbi:RNA interference and gene silencing protein [Colletotrichum kahawae]|uniref:RNA interference and gene silencing protein n=1 Tax=Colletotrichum kahawae TaxID=34407 RepID=A0AAD9YL44_COLKA|nr:RNA interference and gene silencing protein [Colletotrichum kahawae]